MVASGDAIVVVASAARSAGAVGDVYVRVGNRVDDTSVLVQQVEWRAGCRAEAFWFFVVTVLSSRTHY
jgi:hypothetical protein